MPMHPTNVSASARRIQKELAEVAVQPPFGCSAGPKGDNIYEWAATLIGPPSACCSCLRPATATASWFVLHVPGRHCRHVVYVAWLSRHSVSYPLVAMAQQDHAGCTLHLSASFKMQEDSVVQIHLTQMGSSSWTSPFHWTTLSVLQRCALGALPSMCHIGNAARVCASWLEL